MWVTWLLVAVGLAVGEMVSTSFYLAPFSLGAFAALALTAAGLGFVPQVILFLAVSGLVFQFVRPIAKRHLTAPPAIRTGTAALVGSTAVVMSPVDDVGGTVKIGGEVWSARTMIDGEHYGPGTRVQVIDIKGATALVTD